ncbi:hypothetical protein D3C71_1637540 [compost metagenome]
MRPRWPGWRRPPACPPPPATGRAARPSATGSRPAWRGWRCCPTCHGNASASIPAAQCWNTSARARCARRPVQHSPAPSPRLPRRSVHRRVIRRCRRTLPRNAHRLSGLEWGARSRRAATGPRSVATSLDGGLRRCPTCGPAQSCSASGARWSSRSCCRSSASRRLRR